MAKSIADQLLEAGAVDRQKATKIKKQKHKRAKQVSRGADGDSEAHRLAEAAKAEKIARDRALNRERQRTAEENAVRAQIRQLIDSNIIGRDSGDIPYNFSDASVVKKIFVTNDQQRALSEGRIAIAMQGDMYVLIPAAAAEKIAERDPDTIKMQNTRSEAASDAEDDYSDYVIPDDLTW